MEEIFKPAPCSTIEEFESMLKSQIKEYYETKFSCLPVPNVVVKKGSKFYKIVSGNSVWGFVARIPMIHKGVQIRKGDLMKPAGRNQAAKHARGNVIEGTANYSAYGPAYLI